MGDVITKKIRISGALLLILWLVIMTVPFFIWKTCNISVSEDREIRVAVNEFLESVKQNECGNWTQNTAPGYPYAIFRSDGTVMVSTIKTYRQGEKKDVSTLGGSSQYLVPFTNIQGIKGLILIDVEKYRMVQFRKSAIGYAVFGVLSFAALCMIFIHVRRYLVKDVKMPLVELDDSVNNILNGNLKERVSYDYDGMIGRLCHDFELMRDELYSSRKREAEWREKERVLYASISHDLKTPLAIMQGNLEEILYGIIEDPEEVGQALQSSLDKIARLNKLVNDILEHSKAQLNQFKIEKREVYAADYFGKYLSVCAEELKHTKGTLTYELPENVMLLMDTDRMNQVMQNLIGNSVKYAEGYVNIKVSFKMEKGSPDFLIVTVEDDGCGIDAVDIPFVFDLFYRGNKARTQDIPGSGIGLHVTKYIVERHGGSIECDSIAGVGTTISFALPIM